MELLVSLYANGIKLKSESIEKLRKYLSLLTKWNNTHALTSATPRDVPYVFAVEPLLFAEEIEKFIKPVKVLDIGTGFGNPGVAMALYFEKSKFVLVDSSAKKTALLRSAVDICAIDNVDVLTNRIEKLSEEFLETFDLVVSRGVGEIRKVTDYAVPFVKKGGAIAILKARMNMDEISNVKPALKLENVLTMNVSYPGKKVRRYVVIYRR